MDDKSFSTSFDDSVLQTKEIEVVKKISFWANLFYKLKNKDLKLLPPGEITTKNTYQSIDTLWNIGKIKSSIFSFLDSFSQKFSNNSEINNIPGTLDSEEQKNIIIPQNIKYNNKNDS